MVKLAELNPSISTSHILERVVSFSSALFESALSLKALLRHLEVESHSPLLAFVSANLAERTCKMMILKNRNRVYFTFLEPFLVYAWCRLLQAFTNLHVLDSEVLLLRYFLNSNCNTLIVHWFSFPYTLSVLPSWSLHPQYAQNFWYDFRHSTPSVCTNTFWTHWSLQDHTCKEE